MTSPPTDKRNGVRVTRGVWPFPQMLSSPVLAKQEPCEPKSRCDALVKPGGQIWNRLSSCHQPTVALPLLILVTRGTGSTAVCPNSLMKGSLAGHRITTSSEHKQRGWKTFSWDKGSFLLFLLHGVLQEGTAGLRNNYMTSKAKSLVSLKCLLSSEA